MIAGQSAPPAVKGTVDPYQEFRGLKAESGQIQLARGSTAGYLHQDHNMDMGRTLREEAGHAFAELESLHAQLEETAEAMGTAEPDQLDALMKKYEQLEERMEASGGYAVDHKIDETLHAKRPARPLQAAVVRTGFVASRRTHQPPRHRRA